MKKITTYTTIFLAAILLTLACKKEKPELSNGIKDPCSCSNEVSADFAIEEKTTYIPEDIWVESDTVIRGATVRFTAKEENANYTWYIGTQVFNTRSVFRNFGQEWSDVDIPITLVVTKEPNTVCFPNDDGHDSIVQTFHIINPNHFWNDDQTEYVNWATAGTYRMISPSHQDSFDITVRIFKHPLYPMSRYVAMENWDGYGNDCFSYSKGHFGSAYRFYAFQETGTQICTSLTGHIIRPLNGPAELKMRSLIIDNATLQPIEEHFHYKGRKL